MPKPLSLSASEFASVSIAYGSSVLFDAAVTHALVSTSFSHSFEATYAHLSSVPYLARASHVIDTTLPEDLDDDSAFSSLAAHCCHFVADLQKYFHGTHPPVADSWYSRLYYKTSCISQQETFSSLWRQAASVSGASAIVMDRVGLIVYRHAAMSAALAGTPVGASVSSIYNNLLDVSTVDKVMDIVYAGDTDVLTYPGSDVADSNDAVFFRGYDSSNVSSLNLRRVLFNRVSGHMSWKLRSVFATLYPFLQNSWMATMSYDSFYSSMDSDSDQSTLDTGVQFEDSSIDRDKHFCARCQCNVRTFGHEDRCGRPLTKLYSVDRAWVGDARHILDLRCIFSTSKLPRVDMANAVAARVHARSQAIYLRKVKPDVIPHDRSDTQWSSVFEDMYEGTFRSNYLEDLLRELNEHDQAMRFALPGRHVDVPPNAWVGKAIHEYDLRSIIVCTDVPSASRGALAMQYVKVSAKADYYRSLFGFDITDKQAADKFALDYSDKFRRTYLMWFLRSIASDGYELVSSLPASLHAFVS